MKIIIAGGRDFVATPETLATLDRLAEALGITEMVSGGARGGDQVGEDWARARGLPVRVFPADWKAHGRGAGPKRNQQMAEYADALIALPGGRGTADMVRRATERGLQVMAVRQ